MHWHDCYCTVCVDVVEAVLRRCRLACMIMHNMFSCSDARWCKHACSIMCSCFFFDCTRFFWVWGPDFPARTIRNRCRNPGRQISTKFPQNPPSGHRVLRYNLMIQLKRQGKENKTWTVKLPRWFSLICGGFITLCPKLFSISCILFLDSTVIRASA